MTDKQNTGGPAFPCDCIPMPNGKVLTSDGMTLRDYFAAKAMQGLVSVELTEQNIDMFRRDKDGHPSVSLTAYYIADAMLKAREQ